MKSDSTIYRCSRDERGRAVCEVGTGKDSYLPLPARNDIFDHSPDGFEWGYGGSGPAQLGLAVLAHFTWDDELALRLHQRFKAEFLATMPREGLTFTGQFVRTWISNGETVR